MGCLSFRLKFNKLEYGNENGPLEDHKPTSNEAQHPDDGTAKSLLFFLYC